jgi:hypothetical protein
LVGNDRRVTSNAGSGSEDRAMVDASKTYLYVFDNYIAQRHCCLDRLRGAVDCRGALGDLSDRCGEFVEGCRNT